MLKLPARDLSDSGIAVRLVVSAATVESPVNRLLGELSRRDRAQASVLAREAGLGEPDAGARHR